MHSDKTRALKTNVSERALLDLAAIELLDQEALTDKQLAERLKHAPARYRQKPADHAASST